MKNINIFFSSLILLLGLTFLVGCDEDLVEYKEVVGTPVITEFSPQSGKVGTEITITGEYLQKIDSVWIGGQLSQVKHRVSPTEVVVAVTANSKSGKILISGYNGKIETTDAFTVQYTVPSLTKYPITAKVNDDIYIEGDNMDAVISVLFGTAEGVIVAKTEKDMVVQVPFFTDNKVDIVLNYNTADGVKQTGTTGQPFALDKVVPSIDSYVTQAEVGSMITITGSNLSLVDEVWFGDYKGAIMQKEDASISVTVPADFTEQAVVALKMLYYGDVELIVTNSFTVTIPTAETIYYWENITTFCQDPANTDNFFNAVTGEVYTPCDYPLAKNNITFYTSISGGNFQLNNPNNSENQTKNFKCEGVNLPTEKMPVITKFRILKADIDAEKKYIDLVKSKQLNEIDLQTLIADGTVVLNDNGEISTANTPRFNAASNGFVEGDVILLFKCGKITPNSTTLILPSDVEKVGFIEVKQVNMAATVNQSSWTFNCYYQK